MNLIGLIRQLNRLKSTVRSSWGTGLRAWFYFLFYGLFRVNRFKIMKVNLKDQHAQMMDMQDVTLFSPSLAELDLFRSQDELPREFYCDQYHKVSFCCVATVESELAYIHWIYLKGDYSRFLILGDDSAEINYVLTLPKFRGRHLSAAALIYTIHDLKEKGKKNIYAVVHDKNIASIKSFRRAGFVEVGDIISICQFNKKIKV